MPDPADNKPSVFIVDDDKQLLDSLVTLLEVLGFQVRAFSTPDSFLRFYRREMPGCLVLDIRMPGQTGLELYQELLRDGKRLPVIFVTADADVTIAVAAMKTGAIEFLEKPFDRDILVDRVRKAIALDAQWRDRDAQIAALEERIARLSARERETLQLIQAGESNKSMAAKLLLTERAVEMRRSAIMRKLQVNSVAELLDLTITHRILTDLRQAAIQDAINRYPSGTS
jgi:FixJ family two-component response regulator